MTPEPLDENSTHVGPNLTDYLPLYYKWREHYHVPVSINGSAIHVPTNIYECAPALLDNIGWTEGLDETFIPNYDNIPSAWQYFASSSGFKRFFPAAKWNYNGMDMYDARLTEWYTGAASTPKSVVILLDVSGSMTGLRMEIAKTTVKKIMESLQENDFFNLITFNNDTAYVDCDCVYSNGTLIQATARNILRVSDAMTNIKLTEIANFSRAFGEAFKVLQQANQTQLTGGASNNAIMVVTDGAPESYEQVFKEFNWDNITLSDGSYKIKKWARVFSYLIGQEVTLSSKDIVKWMACANKGYFYHIGTMADVHDYVQDYVRVMARPLVVHNSNHFTWTGVHVSPPLVEEGLSSNTRSKSKDWIRLPSHVTEPMLLISVALPVYDLRKDERNNGNLLGVAGVDVNLDDILKFIRQAQLGIMGYAFIINNNGFVVWHPDFDPWIQKCQTDLCTMIVKSNPLYRVNSPRPDYKNIDLQYLEQEAEPSEGNIARLRKAMIEGSNGNIIARVKKFYSKKLKKIYIQSQTYYYAPIPNTPYSIAIVRVEPVDRVIVYTDKPFDSQPFDWCRMVVADWNYCDVSVQELAQSTPLERLQKTLSFKNDSCDWHLAAGVLYDAIVTHSIHWTWAQDQISAMNSGVVDGNSPCTNPVTQDTCELQKRIRESERTLNFEIIVLGTRSGVTRYQEGNSSGGAEVIDGTHETCTIVQKASANHILTRSVDADYFIRAATATKDIWTFDVSRPDNIESLEDIMVTASRGVYLPDSDVMVAAFGLGIQYQSLYQMLNLTTSFCSVGLACENMLCSKIDVDCFLLDDNGYIIVSEDESDVNKSFGEIDYQVMLDMQDRQMFQEIVVTDYQALCTVCKNPTDSSSASSLIDPFRYLSKILWWYITKAALFLIEFSVYDMWHCLYYATATVSTSSANSSAEGQLPTVATERHTVLFMPNTDDIRSPSSSQLELCLSACKVYRNSSIESLGIDTNSSSKIRTLSYMAHRVPKTNLYLLVLEAGCRCDGQNSETCIEEHELDSGCSSDIMDRYRQPPRTSASTSLHSAQNLQSKYEEELDACDHGNLLRASMTVVTTLVIVVLWVNR